MMTLIKLRASRRYWETHSRASQIADTMTRDTFEGITRSLHFEESDAEHTRTSKFQPIVDEQIVAYKGKKSSLRQYNLRKPKKWGFKIFVLSGRSGVIHKIEFYGSVVDNDNTHKVGKSGMVVVRLAKIIPKHKNFKLYFDNWFNSPELLVALAKDGLQSIGTLQPNRAKGLVFSSGPSAMPRGTIEVKAALVDGVDVYAIRWMDNRYVHLLSTFSASLPVAELDRFDRKRRQYIKVRAPAATLAYNNHMGHVDEVNSYIARYRMTTQTRARYYIKIFLHFVNMIATNCWAVYRRDCELDNVTVKDRLSLFAFKSQLASSLMRVNVSSRGVGRHSTVDQQIAA